MFYAIGLIGIGMLIGFGIDHIIGLFLESLEREDGDGSNQF